MRGRISGSGLGRDGRGEGAERRPQVLSGEMGPRAYEGEEASGREGASSGKEMLEFAGRQLSGGAVSRGARGVRGGGRMSAVLGIAAVLLCTATNGAEALEELVYSQRLSVTAELRGIALEDFGEVRTLFPPRRLFPNLPQ